MVARDKVTVRACKELVEVFNRDYPPSSVDFVPTGSVMLDYLFGGGFPRGKVVLFSSAKALGKTLVAVSMCKSLLQSTKGVVLYLDVEQGLDKSLIEKVIPEDVRERFIVHTPATYEAAELIIEGYSASKEGLIGVIIDSVTALLPESVLDKENNRIGAKASAEGMFTFRLKIMAAVNRFGVLYINQQRANIQMSGGGKGSPYKAAGGFALPHNIDYDIMMKPDSFVKDLIGNKIGACVRLVNDKNRVVGDRSVYLYLKYGYGISNIASIVSLLKFKGFVKAAGPYFKVTLPFLDKEVNVNGNAGIEGFVQTHFDELVKTVCTPELVSEYALNFKP